MEDKANAPREFELPNISESEGSAMTSLSQSYRRNHPAHSVEEEGITQDRKVSVPFLDPEDDEDDYHIDPRDDSRFSDYPEYSPDPQIILSSRKTPNSNRTYNHSDRNYDERHMMDTSRSSVPDHNTTLPHLDFSKLEDRVTAESLQFMKESTLTINEVVPLNASSVRKSDGVISEVWERRGTSTPRLSVDLRRLSDGRGTSHSIASMESSASPRSSVSNAFQAGLGLNGLRVPRMTATTEPLSVASPLHSRLSVINSLSENVPSTARPSLHDSDQNIYVDEEVRLDSSNAQHLFTRESAASYVATLQAAMVAPFFTVQCSIDINRVAASQNPPPRQLNLESMYIDRHTVSSLLQYNNEVNDIVDLLFENCTFATSGEFTWLKQLHQLRSLRVKGQYVTSAIINEMLRNAPGVQSLTIFECPLLSNLEVLNDPTCTLRAIQVIHTNFTSEAFGQIVNCASLREVLLFQIDLQANVFELLNTDHIELLQVVSCPDLYYEEKPREKWVSTTSPRVGYQRHRTRDSDGTEDNRSNVCLSIESLVISDCASLTIKKLPWKELGRLKHLSIMYQNGVKMEDLQGALCNGFLKLLRLQQLFIDEETVEFLSHCRQLKELNLSFCKGMVGLNELWEHLPNLSRLNLSYSDVTSVELVSLEKCGRLKELYARGCKYIEDFGIFRSLHSLEMLDLTDCTGINNETLTGAYKCSRLRKLIIDDCPQLYDISAFGCLKSLEEIQASGTGVRGADVRTLSECYYLYKMDISYCRCIETFTAAKFNRLKTLNASHSSISDACLCALAECERLEEVNLSYCEEVFSIEGLKNVTTLTSLNLSYSSISTDGFNAFAANGDNLRIDFVDLSGCTGIVDIFAIEKLDTMRTLLLTMSSVSEASLPYIAKCRSLEVLDLCGCPQIKFAGELSKLLSLRVLDLSLTSIGDDTIRELGSGCEMLDHMEISGCTQVTDVTALSNLKFLERLNVSGTSVYSHTLESFILCPVLWDINVTNCPNVHDISPLGDTKALQRIDASETKVADVSFLRAWRCTSLEELRLKRCSFLKSVLPISFRGMTSLRRVDFSGSAIKDSSFAAIAECPSIEVLILDRCPNIFTLTSLQRLVNLRIFSAAHTNLEDSTFDAISLCEALEEVDVSYCSLISDFSTLSYCKKLRRITAAHSSVSDLSFGSCWDESPLIFLDLSYCKEIFSLPLISSMRMLQELNLTGSSIHDSGIVNISTCTSMRNLYLNECELISSVVPLNEMKSLKYLNLSKSAVEFLSEDGCFWKTRALQYLSLRECKNIRSVACLSELTDLYTLDLAFSSVSDSSFCNCWDQLTCLEEFNLQGCKEIGSVSSLCDLSNLVELILTSSAANNECVKSLSFCGNLERLNLSFCENVTDASPLRNLSHLQQLVLKGCKFLSDVTFEEAWTCDSLLELDLTLCKSITRVDGLSSLKKLKNLSLAKTSVVMLTLPSLVKCQSLEELDFRGCYHLINFSILARLTRLRVLYLSDSGVDDSSIVSISRCKNLRALEIVNCTNIRNMFVPFEFGSLLTLKLTAMDAILGSFMSGCPTLEHLALINCPASFRPMTLKPLSHLRILDLTDAEVDGSIFEPLQTCSANLEELFLVHCVNIFDVSSLGKMRRLKVLDLSRSPVRDVSWEGVKDCRTLQTLRVRECASIRDLTPLRTLDRLRVLDVSGSGMANCSLSLLPQLRSLEQFIAARCNSIVDIAVLYKGMPYIRCIDLGGVAVEVDEETLYAHCPYLETILWGDRCSSHPNANGEQKDRESVEREAEVENAAELEPLKVVMTTGGKSTAPNLVF